MFPDLVAHSSADLYSNTRAAAGTLECMRYVTCPLGHRNDAASAAYVERVNNLSRVNFTNNFNNLILET